MSIKVPHINAKKNPNSESAYSDLILLPTVEYIKAYCGKTTKYIIVQSPKPRVSITKKQNMATAKYDSSLSRLTPYKRIVKFTSSTYSSPEPMNWIIYKMLASMATRVIFLLLILHSHIFSIVEFYFISFVKTNRINARSFSYFHIKSFFFGFIRIHPPRSICHVGSFKTQQAI